MWQNHSRILPWKQVWIVCEWAYHHNMSGIHTFSTPTKKYYNIPVVSRDQCASASSNPWWPLMFWVVLHDSCHPHHSFSLFQVNGKNWMCRWNWYLCTYLGTCWWSPLLAMSTAGQPTRPAVLAPPVRLRQQPPRPIFVVHAVLVMALSVKGHDFNFSSDRVFGSSRAEIKLWVISFFPNEPLSIV
jgi:hypothetical protein